MTTLPRPLVAALSEGFGCALEASQSASGGSVNNAARVEFRNTAYFVKWNSDAPRGFFEAEAASLQALRKTQTLYVPEPLVWRDADPATSCPAYLLLEYISPPTSTVDRATFAQQLADQLHALHTSTHGSATTYGFERSNFIGLLPQDNTPSEDWVTFWIEHRLQAQLQRACDNKALRDKHVRAVESICSRLSQWVPKHPSPSLLHGDLWSGNYLICETGQPAVIDPATYRGHYEVDLAMMDLFGGFPHTLMDAYRAHTGCPEGWDERRRVYQAYYVLVHVNLFGGSYPKQLMQLLKPIL